MIDSIRASALAALPEIGSNGDLPADIQVFPPGPRIPFTLQGYPGEKFEMDVDASVADKANEDLQNLISRAASGQGSQPFADKNHEDAEKTFTPVRYFWGGDDKIKGGVRLVPDWNPFGAALVRAKAFSYFSQNFLFSKAKKKFVGLINENIGGLVNRPGFATQAAFAKAAEPLTTNQDMLTTEDKTELAKTIGEAIAKVIQPLIDQLKTIQGHAGAATPASVSANEFLNQVMAAHAKGMTMQAAAQEVSCRHPELFAAYREPTVFQGRSAAV